MTKLFPTFIIDFDNTFVTIEALDELAIIALRNHPKKDKITKKIADITKTGMLGKIDFQASLSKRLSLFQPQKEDINKLIQVLKKHITPSVIRNKEFFKKHKANIYIITGGFKEYVLPVVADFGIYKSHVIANTFIFDKQGKVIGYDKKNPLANSGVKTEAIKKLNISGEIIVIGDGYTDYEAKKNGAAEKFFAFVENISRKGIVEKADKIIKSFDEIWGKK